MILFEDAGFANLLPIAYWRTVFELMCGRSRLWDQCERLFGAAPVGAWTRSWIAATATERLNVPVNGSVQSGDILVNGRWAPDGPVTFEAAPQIGLCDGAIAYVVCDDALASKLGPEDFLDRRSWSSLVDRAPTSRAPGRMLEYPWDILTRNAIRLKSDWNPAKAGVHGEVHASAVLVNENEIRIDTGVDIGPLVVLDATEGPIAIESGTRVHPHAVIRGPAHIGPGCAINPHADIHGGTTLGPVCKVGGEVDGCVFQGYSNKQHDGFLGQAFVGSWVNFGAGTVNSNLKNTYGSIRAPINGTDVDSGQMFFGGVIGDFVKTGIGQCLPTGAVLGFATNVSTARLAPRFMRSFTWLTDQGLEEGDADRLIKTAAIAMDRRGQTLTAAESKLFEKLVEIAAFFEPVLDPSQFTGEGSIHELNDLPPQPSLAEPR
jgi:UDP-N-acetylglucosamine diphosphorylase/glucosamine-1-phosphate N-acetyltransferase